MQKLPVVSHTVCAHVGGPKNLGTMSPAPLDVDMADPLATRYSPHVIIPKCRRCRSSRSGWGVQKNWGHCGPATLRYGRAWPHINMLLPMHLCCRVKFGHSKSNGTSAMEKFDLHPPFMITQGQWNRTGRSTTYDFLLTFHSHYGPISYRLWDIDSDICNIFLTPCI